ncbi:MAG: hypothetical protein Q4C89_01460 [Deinococcus sp.]|uniref:hypothetical protein n=1 Tax=Deinococcus sp. TaxID=47478 RepID=UPI0026DC1421|nr:hypothetical protein [Deinococcus sp.]MDO4244676.1 hypothetical protein [Deinococcus sp.]
MLRPAPHILTLTFSPEDFAALPTLEEVSPSQVAGRVCLDLSDGAEIHAAPHDLTLYRTPHAVPFLLEVRQEGQHFAARLPEDFARLFAWALEDFARVPAVLSLLTARRALEAAALIPHMTGPDMCAREYLEKAAREARAALEGWPTGEARPEAPEA